MAPPRRINQIVKSERSITADTALRLAAFFGTDALSDVLALYGTFCARV